MTNNVAIKALKDIKTYCAADALDALEYVIKVMEKLEDANVKNPLESDFTKVK